MVSVNQNLLDRATLFRSDVLAQGHASLILPAGCGKTEILASTVTSAALDARRVLVLTHTNAGVGVIRRRLRSYGADTSLARVSTIDAFIQRVALAFPSLGDELVHEEDEAGYWDELRIVALQILACPPVLQTMNSSYDLLVVDEYQDCTTVQHDFVSLLASQVRCLVLGDPLQAVFGFGNNVLVDWDDQVVPCFAQVEVNHFEQEPWRWRGKNEALGDWLHNSLRPSLVNGGAVSLQDAPGVIWSQSTPALQQNIHLSYLQGAQSTVFILPAKHRVRPFAKTRRGRFTALEDVQMSAALKEAKLLDDASHGGGPMAAAVIRTLATCATGISALVSAGSQTTLLARLEASTPLPTGGAASRRQVRIALNVLMEENTPKAVADTFDAFLGADSVNVFARDCLRDLARATETVRREDQGSYTEAVLAMRSSRKYSGHSHQMQCSSHTLLVKGLEFDRCIVLDAQALQGRENFYVAMTRGSAHLRVLSESPHLQFPNP